MRKSALINGILVLILSVAVALVWYSVVRTARHDLIVSFLDVGQGDSIYIETPSGRQMLIDGGKGVSVIRELSQVVPFWDRTLDVVVATHPDADHIGGLIEILPRYHVDRVITSSVLDAEGSDSKEFERLMVEEHAENLVAQRGELIDLGDGVLLEILFPDREVARIETNTGSVIARLSYGDTSFMLTGDSPQAIEEYLAQLDGTQLRSNVLKVGHHGSKTSSAPLFLGYVDAEYAVISRGCENSYGHPHQEVLDALARFQMEVLDTCEDGTITFLSDGATVRRK